MEIEARALFWWGPLGVGGAQRSDAFDSLRDGTMAWKGMLQSMTAEAVWRTVLVEDSPAALRTMLPRGRPRAGGRASRRSATSAAGARSRS